MDKEYPYGEGIVKWVDTEWLEDHLSDENILIVDVQANIHDYLQEHIPGAVYLNEGIFRIAAGGIPAQWVPPESIRADFGKVGIHNDQPIVVYTGTGAFTKLGDGLEHWMAAYSLARYGHNNIHVLDGGLDKWRHMKKPLAQEYPVLPESDYNLSVRNDFFLTYEQFLTIMEDENVIILDARPSSYYEGQGPWMKPGHIPGAVNLPWKSLMEDRNRRLLKPDEDLYKIIDKTGITAEKTIICSCGTGREATSEFLLFRYYFGFPNVKLFEGSFVEWVAYPENPTITGKEPGVMPRETIGRMTTGFSGF